MLALGDGVRIVCVVAWLTFWPVTDELLVRKSASPLYLAVMEWLPRVRPDVGRLALPAVRAMVPSVVVPSRKVTEPVGTPAPGAVAVTAAVNVTVWPYALGFADELRVVVDFAWLTFWLSSAEVLVTKLSSPL